MLDLNLQACASAMPPELGAQLIGDNVTFTSVSTDTRTLQAGQLLVALQGERFDAHDKIDAQTAKTASALVVGKRLPHAVPQLLVNDTLRALGDIASQWRQRLKTTVIAITGSNGKTTTKEMTASILCQCGAVFATRGNLNNAIGMPLSLLSIDTQDDFAVLELGASHRGEIDYLAAIAQPQVALVNNAGPSHLEGFGSLDGVASAKGEIYAHLPADGIAIVNVDDHYAQQWRDCAGDRTVMGFGFAETADVRGSINANNDLRIDYQGASTTLTLPLPGRHNAMNALAAAAAAIAVGASLADIATGLATVEPSSGRLEFKPGIGGVQLIDDTYNANPGSLGAGLSVLCDNAQAGTWCVLGDMRELGEDSATLHREMGASARQTGVGQLLAIGEFAAETVSGFGPGGRLFDSLDALLHYLKTQLQVGDRVLVKGSRGARMERVVAALVENNNNNNQPAGQP